MDSAVRIPIDGTFNFREPAGYPATHGVTRHGVLYRSDGLRGLTDTGRRQLLELGIDTVIDLRDDFEREMQPDALDDLDIRTVVIPVYEGSAAANSGTGITLDGMYESIVVEHAPVVVHALRTIATDPGAVLVHCTAGKDRTGIVVALALRAVGVDRDIVIDDYARSAANLAGEWLDSMLALVARYGIAETPELRTIMGATPPEVMARLLDLIDASYGSVTEYLQTHGFSADDLAALDQKLVQPA